MSEINIEIKNLSTIKATLKQHPEEMVRNLNKAITKTVFYIRAKSARRVPVRSGYLRSSAYTTFGHLKGSVGFKAKYAGWVHDGTSPYIIRPSSAKALFWKGAAHPVKRVNHPGIRANPFLRSAVEDSEHVVNGFFETAVKDTLDKIGKSA